MDMLSELFAWYVRVVDWQKVEIILACAGVMGFWRGFRDTLWPSREKPVARDNPRNKGQAVSASRDGSPLKLGSPSGD